MAEIIGFIMEADEDSLRTIQNATSIRYKTLAEIKALLAAETIYVGDRVKINSNVTPKKIAGLTGRVTKIEPSNKGQVFTVAFDDPPDYRWRSAGFLGNLFTKIEG